MKYIVIIILLITMTGCKNSRSNEIKKIDKIEVIDNTGYIDDYKDNNPIKVGLYQNNKLVKEVTFTKNNHKEVVT